MARTDKLENFLTDVAAAIKTKTGKTDGITPSNFDTEINSISGSEDLTEELNTYNTKLTEQDIKLSNIINSLQTKAASEDLTEELNTYNTELIEQDSLIDAVIDALRIKIASGKPYAPSFISFYKCPNESLDLENLDTSNLTSLYYTFSNITRIESLDISKLNVDKVENISYAFSYSKFTNISLPKFTNVKNMSLAFQSCTNLSSVTLEDAGKNSAITNVQEMFNGCSNLESVKFGNANLDTDSLYRMFYNCPKLKHVDMSEITNTKTLSQIGNMFYQCTSLEFVDISAFQLSSSTTSINVFAGVPADVTFIVKDDISKNKILTLRSDFTNVKTKAEWEAEQ